ncbi:rhodanese-like domain-containing protein [Paracoccus sp. R12_1]|uniref:rhodanese-like domain-containing protein n=1 Tax=unclassified Paracoccus (in: a-proteobacteria) TaxID=2688777 RepID=UPI001ADBAF46|nr:MULTISPECIES: rhodanese-like domain-containing protein [unclassified Paracoccus (in: a-proteobacteria)]MBO9455828.1 rhodanese-like domain-containing protein [Paracoccus sp. R12_2]MBO9487260.1 rhodanese-like domain-containing protein [Paracoccus sp. R12_1]
MAVGYRQMLDEADKIVQSVSVDEAARLQDDPQVVMVDIRDPRELEREGMIADAFHAPRGMLEFWIDPESPYHKPRFAEDKTYVFYCASGWRSLLAARLAQEMGLDARSMRGGFGDWRKAGHAVATRPAKG